MGKVRFISIIITMSILIGILSSCIYKSYYGKRPCDQIGSTWSSVDGSITFVVNENGSCNGKMLVDGEYIDIHLGIGPSVEIAIYHALTEESEVFGLPIEEWIGDFDSADSFVATIMRSTYYHEGDTIAFVRTSEGEMRERPSLFD